SSARSQGVSTPSSTRGERAAGIAFPVWTRCTSCATPTRPTLWSASPRWSANTCVSCSCLASARTIPIDNRKRSGRAAIMTRSLRTSCCVRPRYDRTARSPITASSANAQAIRSMESESVSGGASQRILNGPLGLAVLRFGTPLALGMGLQTAFNLVDAFVISRLGGAITGPALGAIGICDQLSALGTIVSYGLSVATATLLSRKVGERDQDAVREIAWQSLLVILALSLFFGIFGGFGANFVLRSLVGAKGEVANLGVPYLRVMLAGSSTIFLLMHLVSVQRALGSSKTPVGLLIASNVLNLILAVVMVYGPGDSPAIFAWGRPLARLFGIPRMGLM